MAEEEKDDLETRTANNNAKEDDEKLRAIYLVPFPKVIFLYPTLFVALICALVLSFVSPYEIVNEGAAAKSVAEQSADDDNADGSQNEGASEKKEKEAAPATNKTSGEPELKEKGLAVSLTLAFLVIFALNSIVISFDFPRGTSLTIFFSVAAVVLGLVLIFINFPNILPFMTAWLTAYVPVCNAYFFWGVVLIFVMLYVFVLISINFDYWEVRQNEILHHHGILSDLKRFSAPNLRIDKEINDVFEYMLLGSGRLIVQATGERKAIVLDNILFISKKEKAITQMLGALQVDVRYND